MFEVEVPGGAKVKLADLPMDVIGAAAREGELSWIELYQGPLRDDRAGVALYRACCAAAGVEPPAVVTPKLLIDAFTLAKDDLPTSFEDGNPKEADDPSTP